MVGDDALVLPLTGEGHTVQPQDGGVLHHLASLGPEVSIVLHFCVLQQLVVFFPSESHRGVAAAGSRAGKTHVGAFYRRLRFWLNRDLGFGEIICLKWRRRKQNDVRGLRVHHRSNANNGKQSRGQLRGDPKPVFYRHIGGPRNERQPGRRLRGNVPEVSGVEGAVIF